mmetsp:Transcript_12877/g.36921  ORF Transcript_12877/g.36921 Transcript_12877/m.36921 type:complete len:106 (-) Transcript_12877:5260-5577(-)
MASAANTGTGGPAGSSEAIPITTTNNHGQPEPPFSNVAKSPVDEAMISLGARPVGGVVNAGHRRDMSLSASANCVLEDCRKELSNLRQVRAVYGGAWKESVSNKG